MMSHAAAIKAMRRAEKGNREDLRALRALVEERPATNADATTIRVVQRWLTDRPA